MRNLQKKKILNPLSSFFRHHFAYVVLKKNNLHNSFFHPI